MNAWGIYKWHTKSCSGGTAIDSCIHFSDVCVGHGMICLLYYERIPSLWKNMSLNVVSVNVMVAVIVSWVVNLLQAMTFVGSSHRLSGHVLVWMTVTAAISM